MTEQELTDARRACEDMSHDECRVGIMLQLIEIDRLRATNAGLVADKESDRIAFIAMREQRDELNSIDDELLDETARFRAEVERLNLKVADLQLDNNSFKSTTELP